MNSDNLILLELTNITWDKSEKEKKDLPKELKLNWNSDKWEYSQVLNWVSEYFDVKVDSFNIKELKSQSSTGSGWGGCC